MKSSLDFLPRLPQSFLLIGPPGSGKTTIALQLPRPFILDCDENMNGPIRYLQGNKKLGTDWFYDTPFTDSKGLKTPRAARFERCAELLLEAMNNPLIETIVIDSLTSFVQFVFIQTIISQKGVVTGDIDFKNLDKKFDFEHWGAFLALMQKTIFWLKGCGKRIVICCHIDVDKDELKGTLHNFINVPGKIKHVISGWFEEVWLCQVEVSGVPGTATYKEEYKIITKPDAKSQTLGLKSASGLGASVKADISSILTALQK